MKNLVKTNAVFCALLGILLFSTGIFLVYDIAGVCIELGILFWVASAIYVSEGIKQ